MPLLGLQSRMQADHVFATPRTLCLSHMPLRCKISCRDDSRE